MYTIKKITRVSKTLEKFPDSYLGKSGDLVLDFTCGTSHVAEACAKLGQDFVGLETDLRLYKRKIESVKNGFGYAIV